MNFIKIIFTIFIFSIFSSFSLAQEPEFQHFKLKANLKGAHYDALSKNKLSPNTSALIELITADLGQEYPQIGKTESSSLIKEHDLGGGVKNYSGFSWHKSFATFSVNVNREIAPELFSDKWLVHDTFTIYISASKLLKNYQDKNLISITNDSLEAFAGVIFKRVYHYYHFSENYLSGLTSDYSKLFLPFSKFDAKSIKDLSEYEVIKKVDTFSFNAGAGASVPIGNGMSIEAGLDIDTSYQSETLVQKLGPDDIKKENEDFRVSVDNTFNNSFSADLSLQLDFFNLIKLTLLSCDLEYTFAESNKNYLTFFKADHGLIEDNPEYLEELNGILKGSTDINYWNENITAVEQRSKENLNSKFTFLLYGEMKKRATVQIKIIKNEQQKVFYKNYSESISYIQSLMSCIFSDVILKVFDFPTAIKNKAELRKSMNIEYEHSKKVGVVEKESQFSIQFSQYLYIQDTDKWYQGSLYKKALSHTHNLTSLSSDIIDKIEQKEFKAPFSILTSIEVQEDGLKYFSNLNEDFFINTSLDLCEVSSSSIDEREAFFSPIKRAHLFRRRDLSSELRCARDLVESYLDYQDLKNKHESIDLNAFKKCIGRYFQEVNSLKEIEKIFGAENIFIHGNFQATQQSDKTFQTYFKSGHFKGLGVIDNFKREELTIREKMDHE